MLISLASLNDVEDIMSFINSHWKSNHILSRNEMFFRYEHQYNNYINFIIAKNEDKIVAVLGFIQTSSNNFFECFFCSVEYSISQSFRLKISISPPPGN